MDFISLSVAAGYCLYYFQRTCNRVNRNNRRYHLIWKIPAHTYTGLRFKIPVFEQIYGRISIQNRSVELEFQAVTADQANVYFKSMLLYSVMNADRETIKS